MENKKCKYPTTIQNDFSNSQVQKARSILSQPLDKVHSSLCDLLSEHNNLLITCILRLVLDSPITESSISIIGWYFINSLIPTPTAFFFIKEMTNLLNSSKNSPSEKGFVLNILFARTIFSRLSKYTVYCKALLANPCLQFDNELYIAIHQFAHEPVPLEFVDTRYYFVPPKKKKYFQPITFHEQVVPLLQQDPSIQMKQNLFNSIEYARSLDADQQRLYCINICLKHPPTSLKIRFLPFLSAICFYIKSLLLQICRNSWDAFEMHPQIERMGSWLGVLTNSQGRPPPLYMINIPKLLRDSIDCGTFGHAMVFLTAFYSKVLNLYQPPHPITNLVLEILASVLNTPGIRTDIIAKINKFGELLKVNISYYFNRSIKVPENSFDRYGQFSIQGDSVIFKPAILLKGEESDVDIQYCLNSYFHYVPNPAMLPSDEKLIFKETQQIEKYYFVDQDLVISPRVSQYADPENLQYIVSLAIADSPILAKTASRLFLKIVKKMQPLNLTQIFRCAFPNKYIFAASLRANCFSPNDINSLFSELLTNPYSAPLALPMILEFMPSCLEFYPEYSFSSLKELTNYVPNKIERKDVPKPNAAHIQLLRVFLSFSRSRDDSNRNSFTSKMSKATSDHIVSLISFVLCATIKRNSPKTSSAIDYSAIDSLCFALGKCAGRIDSDALISSCTLAIMKIASSVIDKKPKALFRLVNGLFGWLHFRSNLKMIELLDFLSPVHFPSFSLCWIQLVMHRAAFPTLVKTNEQQPMQFCLNFVITCLKLTVDFPDIFYRSVCRILITISSCSPLFFISYHQLLLECLPVHFVQFRNIILGSNPSEDSDDSSPPIGFDYKETLKAKTIIQVVDTILQKKEKDREKVKSTSEFLTSVFKRVTDPANDRFIPRLIWQFAFYCIKKSADANMVKCTDDETPSESFINSSVPSLFVAFFASLHETNVFSLRFLIESIIDQIRYPNKHTTFASFLLYAVFKKSNSEIRELILVLLIKRLMCVTQPPQALKKLYSNLIKNFANEVNQIFEENNELSTFKKVQKIID